MNLCNRSYTRTTTLRRAALAATVLLSLTAHSWAQDPAFSTRRPPNQSVTNSASKPAAGATSNVPTYTLTQAQVGSAKATWMPSVPALQVDLNDRAGKAAGAVILILARGTTAGQKITIDQVDSLTLRHYSGPGKANDQSVARGPAEVRQYLRSFSAQLSPGGTVQLSLQCDKAPPAYVVSGGIHWNYSVRVSASISR